MTRRLARAAVAVAITVFSLSLGPAHAQETGLLTIATAQHGGVYLSVGNAICRFVNAERARHGLRCLARSSAGSVQNIEALRAGERAYALVQSDVQRAALDGTKWFADAGPLPGLRVLFSLYVEPFAVVARGDAGISDFRDIEGHAINLGKVGSGMRATTETIVKAFGLTLDDFPITADLAPKAQVEALCNRDIDVATFTVGHPSGWIYHAARTCGAVLVPVAGPPIDRLLQQAPYYTSATIAGATYPHQTEDVPTIGVRATLITLADRPEEEVYEVVRAVFENLDTFKRLHPALAELQRRQMVAGARTAPLHPGAEHYFREAGLLP